MSKFAVIKTGSKQYLVKNGQQILIEKSSDGKTPKFEVLLFFDGKKLEVGTPVIETKEVSLELLDAVKGPKIKIWKHRAKKHSRTKSGHRQKLAKVQVNIGKEAQKTEPKKSENTATKSVKK